MMETRENINRVLYNERLEVKLEVKGQRS
jgi:hypothetical protein